jgi:hypothetical protein
MNNESQPVDAGAPLSGMTVNERLYTLGLLDEFSAAARRRDRHVMIELLTKAQLSATDSTGCADAILNNPKKYGF